jgi:ribosome-associated protein
MLTVNEQISIRVSEFQFSFARSPGPGGQHVNKVNSKAILKWSVKKTSGLPDDVKQRFLERYARRISKDGVLVIQSHRYRDQGRNVADCLHKLREMLLAVAVKPTIRKPTTVTKAAQRRRIESKKRLSDKKRGRRPPARDD